MALLVCVSCVAPAWAHPDPASAHHELSQRLQRDCAEGARPELGFGAYSKIGGERLQCGWLHLRRAEVSVRLRQIEPAREDLAAAAQRGVPEEAIQAVRAALAQASNDPAAAQVALRAALASEPAPGGEAASRSRLLRLASEQAARAGRWHDAAQFASAALAAAPAPSPELFTFVARAQQQNGQIEAALRALVRGSAVHPEVASLIDARLEMLLGSDAPPHHAEAYDLLTQRLTPPVGAGSAAAPAWLRLRWYERRAELLLQQDRAAAAARDYRSALALLGEVARSRPKDHQRLTDGVARSERLVRGERARVAAAPSAEPGWQP